MSCTSYCFLLKCHYWIWLHVLWNELSQNWNCWYPKIPLHGYSISGSNKLVITLLWNEYSSNVTNHMVHVTVSEITWPAVTTLLTYHGRSYCEYQSSWRKSCDQVTITWRIPVTLIRFLSVSCSTTWIRMFKNTNNLYKYQLRNHFVIKFYYEHINNIRNYEDQHTQDAAFTYPTGPLPAPMPVDTYQLPRST